MAVLPFFLIVSLLCVGCTRVVQVEDYSPTKDEVQKLLQQEIVIDSAVQIALLNNPEIQALFEEIGIAQADLVEAGLFQNPIFDAYVRFPDRRSLHLNTAFSITQSFLDIFLIPLRKKIAADELEQTYLRVSNALLNLSFDVQETYYNLQAEQNKQNLLESLMQANEAAKDLAKAQKQQGNINELVLQSRMNEYLESKLTLAQSQLELIRLKERMKKLLGLSEFCFKISEDLPELPEYEPSDDCLESIALSQRLDLEIARLEVKKIGDKLGLKQWWSYTNIAAGISTEHEAEGFQETGPAFTGAIPLFNYGQADRARLYAMHRQSLKQLQALEIKVLAEVHSARDQLMVNRNLVLTYQEELLPLQKEIVSMSQSFYNTMTLSVYKLLDAKRKELQMEIDYKVTLKNYWVSQVELDRALGGHL